jgi:hypothetical protein
MTAKQKFYTAKRKDVRQVGYEGLTPAIFQALGACRKSFRIVEMEDVCFIWKLHGSRMEDQKDDSF